jgi:hypothetical protein
VIFPQWPAASRFWSNAWLRSLPNFLWRRVNETVSKPPETCADGLPSPSGARRHTDQVLNSECLRQVALQRVTGDCRKIWATESKYGMERQTSAGLAQWHDHRISRLAHRDRPVPARRRFRIRRSANDRHPQWPICRWEPTGRKMDVTVACVFEFEEDRLVCEKVYFDMATVMRQLGKL